MAKSYHAVTFPNLSLRLDAGDIPASKYRLYMIQYATDLLRRYKWKIVSIKSENACKLVQGVKDL